MGGVGFALGKLNVIAGEPGEGKSTLTMESQLASRLEPYSLMAVAGEWAMCCCSLPKMAPATR